MEIKTINSHTSENPKKWSWFSYFSLLGIGIGVFILSTTGFSKIVLLLASIIGLVSAIYYGLAFKQRSLATLFVALGLASAIAHIFLPLSDSPFGWDKLITMFLGAVVGKIAFMAYFGNRESVNSV